METKAAVKKVTAAVITRAQSKTLSIARSLRMASETAAPARLKPMIATTEPVTIGGIKPSIQPRCRLHAVARSGTKTAADR
jgi:hypothetical protein